MPGGRSGGSSDASASPPQANERAGSTPSGSSFASGAAGPAVGGPNESTALPPSTPTKSSPAGLGITWKPDSSARRAARTGDEARHALRERARRVGVPEVDRELAAHGDLRRRLGRDDVERDGVGEDVVDEAGPVHCARGAGRGEDREEVGDPPRRALDDGREPRVARVDEHPVEAAPTERADGLAALLSGDRKGQGDEGEGSERAGRSTREPPPSGCRRRVLEGAPA